MNIRIIIAVIIIIGGFVLVILNSAHEEAVMRFTVDQLQAELAANPEKINGKFLTVMGNVKEGSIKKKGITADFILTLGNKELDVYFTGKSLLPDTFKDGAQASVDGTYDPQQKKLMAEKVMAKCASKYSGPVDYKKAVTQ